MFSPESTTESEMSSAESIMTPKTSFLSDLEFCQATDKITHEGLKGDILNGKFDPIMKMVAVDIIEKKDLTNLAIHTAVSNFIGGVYPEKVRTEDGIWVEDSYDLIIAPFGTYHFLPETHEEMKPFHDKRYVFDVVYAAVIETLKSRGCEIERKVGFVDMEEAITAHRVLWQKNWDMGYPKDISQGEIEMISAQRRMEEESIIFIETWQDTTANLNKVMRQVLKEWKGQIFGEKVVNLHRKGRKEHYVLTDDNLGFKKCFFDTLHKMAMEEAKKREETKSRET